MTPDDLRRWGRYATTSPTYTRLVNAIADDEDLMRVLNRIEHSPQPNILFAGVQYLMMSEGEPELSRHFPNFTQFDPGVPGLEGQFRDFVLDREEVLVEIGRTRFTQTNEARRCVALLPAVWMLGHESIHLIDLGTSAALNLILDHFRYRWGDVEWGPQSPVSLETENRGREIVPRELEILSRTGLDLNPINPADPGDARWLEALIWPEHHERRRRLRAALRLQATLRLAGTVAWDVVAGDATETLGPVLSRLPKGEPAIVMHSFALNQLEPEQRDRVGEIIDGARSERFVGRVSFEPAEAGSSLVEVDYGAGLVAVGRAQHHGEWVEF